jgi:superfamily II DNA/RNA helicase
VTDLDMPLTPEQVWRRIGRRGRVERGSREHDMRG